VVGTITLGFSDLEICFCELRRVDAFPLRHGIRKWTAGPQVTTNKRVCGQVTPRWSATLPLQDYGRIARHPPQNPKPAGPGRERYRCLRQERIIRARDSAMLAT
jgi:hypothetical protein